MLPFRQIIIVHEGLLANKIIVSASILRDLELSLVGKELLGQILGPQEIYSGKLNPDKISHIIKNFKYLPLAKVLIAEVYCLLSMDYGMSLSMILQKQQERVDFVPAFLYDDINISNMSNFKLITVNAVVRGLTK